MKSPPPSSSRGPIDGSAATLTIPASPRVIDGIPATFPLERPRIRRRRRRREPVLADVSLPYFLCGTENRLLAYAATSDISVLRIGNPVVLIGPTGVGKTAIAMHLAARAGMALAMEDDADQPAETIYIPASDYMRDYAESIEVDDLGSLQKRLLDAPILIIDDLESLSGRTACQIELGRRLEDRAKAGRMTFVTSRRPLDQIDKIEPSLSSRVVCGLTIALVYPSQQTRQQLIDEFAIALNLNLSPECTDYLCRTVPSESPTRVIESTLRSIELHRRIDGRPIDVPMIKTVLQNAPMRKVVTMEKIVRVAARQFGITTATIRGPSRHKTTVRVRSLSMWLCRKWTDASTHKIGDHFGGRDHTTVMHALAKIDGIIEDDVDLIGAIAKIEDRLYL